MSDEIEVRVDNTKVFASAMNTAILRALEAVGIDIQKIASDNAPYDTGRLSGSISHVVSSDEKAVYIGTNVSYAGYQELGVHSTGYAGANGGRGYLRPAVNDNKQRIHDIFYAALKG